MIVFGQAEKYPKASTSEGKTYGSAQLENVYQFVLYH